MPFVTEHCFLGLTLDGPKLTWAKHIGKLKISCIKRLDFMKRLSTKSWGCNYNTMIIFYKSFIQSKLDYGSIIYGSAAPSQLKKLDIVQNTALRIATGAFKSSPILSLHIETNLMPLDYWRKLQLMLWFRKIQYTSIDHPAFQLLSSDFHYIHQLDWTSGRQVPFIVRASYQLSHLNMSWGAFSPTQVTSPLPPWYPFDRLLNLEYPVEANSKNKVINLAIETAKFNEYCESNYKSFTHIFTDGSHISAPSSTSAALYIPEILFCDSWKLDPNYNILAAEMFAIHKALQFIINHLPSCRTVIFTDSRSALLTLRNYTPPHRTIMVKVLESIQILVDQGTEIILQWIPSHHGIPGNEYVDKLAKEAHDLEIAEKEHLTLADQRRLCRENILDRWLKDRETEFKLSNIGQIRENDLSPFISYIKERKINTALTRLRIGHSCLNSHLNRLNIIDSPNCDHCGQNETIKHVVEICPRYYSYRVKLKYSLQKLNIPFETPFVLGKNVKDQQTKKKLFRHLAIFLKSTGLLDRL